jgi:hypothetical protein
MPIKRLEHWDTTHLHQFLLERRKTPFKWGEHDCCLFAADAIQAITGVDIASDFRGRYSDQASALDAIKSVTGGTTVEDAAVYCATKAGLPELPHPNFAHRGDLVLLNDAGQLIAGVIGLNSKPLSAGEKGMKSLPLSSVKRAWRVGPLDASSIRYAKQLAAKAAVTQHG